VLLSKSVQYFGYAAELQCCANTLNWYKHVSTLINATLLHKFQPMELQLQLFTEIGINVTATIGTFVWTVKQLWFYVNNTTVT